MAAKRTIPYYTILLYSTILLYYNTILYYTILYYTILYLYCSKTLSYLSILRAVKMSRKICPLVGQIGVSSRPQRSARPAKRVLDLGVESGVRGGFTRASKDPILTLSAPLCSIYDHPPFGKAKSTTCIEQNAQYVNIEGWRLGILLSHFRMWGCPGLIWNRLEWVSEAGSESPPQGLYMYTACALN